MPWLRYRFHESAKLDLRPLHCKWCNTLRDLGEKVGRRASLRRRFNHCYGSHRRADIHRSNATAQHLEKQPKNPGLQKAENYKTLKQLAHNEISFTLKIYIITI
ncbi:hypothetical protein M422DRAFT_247508 [Sphaerobolus stellatus SS14]|nr:hypothetical protein M422DRAFT_247508 [Sphaerobolus stellatus SS14]